MLYPAVKSDPRSKSATLLFDRRLRSPVIVGGTGGSGTRLFARLLMILKVNMGSDLNHADDALAFVDWYTKWVNPYASGQASIVEMDEDLARALSYHVASIYPDYPWGWKNPRSIFLWHALAELLPGARFVHVVRDGLTMATSDNQNQLNLHGSTVLGESAQTLPLPEQALRLWARVNSTAADFGASIGGRYLRLRFEDALATPEQILAQLSSFLSLEPPSTLSLSIGQSRQRTINCCDLSEETRAVVSPTLARLGYEPC